MEEEEDTVPEVDILEGTEDSGRIAGEEERRTVRSKKRERGTGEHPRTAAEGETVEVDEEAVADEAEPADEAADEEPIPDAQPEAADCRGGSWGRAATRTQRSSPQRAL